MYRIIIENLEFDVIIGILDFERKKTQKVIINAIIEYDNKKNFIDYAKVCNLIEKTMKDKKYSLIEDALDEISNILKTKFPQIKTLKLTIKKPEILKNALVGVEILRNY